MDRSIHDPEKHLPITSLGIFNHDIPDMKDEQHVNNGSSIGKVKDLIVMDSLIFAYFKVFIP